MKYPDKILKLIRPKRPAAAFFAVLLSLCMVSYAGCGGSVQRYTAAGTAMGTLIGQTIYTDRENLADQVMERLEELEQNTLSWRVAGSEVEKINAAAGDGIIPLSDSMRTYLTILLSVSQESKGAFDMTVGPVVRLWNIDEWAAGGTEADSSAVELPAQEEIAEALARTGYERLQLSKEGLLLPEGMSLDLGAVGKGIACDEIAALFDGITQAGQGAIQGAVISVGGSILTYGQKPDGSPWQVAVVDPFDTAERAGVLSLSGQWCISTSGDYERYIEVDSVRYHHIMDPATGYPADSGVRSVTVVCKSGILSDALSTACFVLGADEGMRLAQQYGAEALFIQADGTCLMTAGMEKIFVPK